MRKASTLFTFHSRYSFAILRSGVIDSNIVSFLLPWNGGRGISIDDDDDDDENDDEDAYTSAFVYIYTLTRRYITLSRCDRPRSDPGFRSKGLNAESGLVYVHFIYVSRLYRKLEKVAQYRVAS